MIIVIKKKNIYLIFTLIIMVILIIVLLMQTTTTTNFSPEKLIVIDPGHGGRDAGATGNNGISEKDINLKIAQKLKILLEQNGYQVLLTRDNDISLHDEGAKNKKASDIKNRKKIIKENNPRLFVSIHLNHFSESKYYGAQVFYPPNSESSKVLAELIQEELKTKVDNDNDRQAKTINTVLLLKDLSVPAVIVECGFLSNNNEEQLLNTDDYQQKLSEAVCSGILRYISYPTIENTVKTSI